MAEIVEIPIELTHFQFPVGVQERLNFGSTVAAVDTTIYGGNNITITRGSP